MQEKELIEKIYTLHDFFREQYELRREREINSVSPYSADINKYIRTSEELEIYKSCNLTETIITRKALIFPIDIHYKYGGVSSNLEKMLKGQSPRDALTGEIIELHHIGQKYDSPFAELPRLTHCSTKTYRKLHDASIESWRLNKQLIILTQQECTEYWKIRGETLAEKYQIEL